MATLFIISTILFYISYGVTLILERNERGSYGTSGMNTLRYVITLLCYILPVISFCNLFEISWYWLAIINFIVCFIIPIPIARVYCFLFGLKTKKQHNYRTGEFEKQHMYEYDSLLTVSLAVVLFIIALLI